MNGTRTTCNSLVLKKGDCITFKNSLLSKLLFNLYNSKMLHAIPKHLLINYRTFQILIFLDVEKIKLFDLYDFRINFKGLIEKIKL